MRSLVCAALLLAAASLAAFAEGGEAPSADIGKVDVVADSSSPLALAPAGSVSIVTAAEIGKSGAASAADALLLAPGVWVSRGGGAGAAATASIGGSTANQVLVVVDGVRLNDARQGGANLALIPAESIERIEVLRGGASAAYGADALGGVIVITTKKSGAKRLSLSVENVSYPTAASEDGAKSYFDGQRIGLDAGGRAGAADIALSAQIQRARNGYKYESADATLVRENAAVSGAAANLSLGVPAAGGRVSALLAASSQDEGVPGSAAYPSPKAEQKDGSFRGSLGWSSDALAGGALALDAMAHGAFSRLDYSDPDYSEDSRHDMASCGLELRAADSLSGIFDLGFGGSLLYEAAHSSAFDDNPDGQPTRFSLGAYVEPELRIGDRLKLKPALRWDWNDNYAAGLSAMLGAVWRASDAFDLRLSGGRSYRAPTFNDLYYVDSWYKGNPDLKAERAWSGELGGDFRFEGLALSAAARVRYVSDLIQLTADYSTMENVDAAFIPSASAEASYRIGPATLKADYEYLYPLDLSGGRKISDGEVMKNLSRHKAGGSADFSFGAFGAGFSIRGWSDRVVSDEELKGAATVDLNASYKATEQLSFSFAARNLFDAAYEVNSGYPMPGVSIEAGAKLSL